MVIHDSLVYQPSSSTEAVIQRTIEGIQRLIKVHNSSQGEYKEEPTPVIEINPARRNIGN